MSSFEPGGPALPAPVFVADPLLLGTGSTVPDAGKDRRGAPVADALDAAYREGFEAGRAQASSSTREVLAAALQDHGRATLIGSRTYGKGRAELPRSNAPGLTAGVLRPNGSPLHGVGVLPSVSASVTELDLVAVDLDHLFGQGH